MANVTAPKVKAKTAYFDYKMEVNNDVEAVAGEKYIAWCDFTTMRVVEVDGEKVLQSDKVTKNEKIDSTIVPLVWINDSLAKRYLISKKDLDTFSKDDLKKRGYN